MKTLWLLLGTCLLAACTSPTAPSASSVITPVPARIFPVPLDSTGRLPSPSRYCCPK